jgi:hypothetical protein
MMMPNARMAAARAACECDPAYGIAFCCWIVHATENETDDPRRRVRCPPRHKIMGCAHLRCLNVPVTMHHGLVNETFNYLATRRRPGILVRTIEQTLKNITHPDTKLVIAVDDDDDGTISVQDSITDPRVIWSIEPRPDSVGEKYNRVMKVAPADVYMVHVDYAPQMTHGFDEKV